MVFALSKILWVLASPASLLILLLLVSLMLSGSSSPARVKLGHKIGYCVAGCLLIIALTPIGSWALTPLENRLPYQPLDSVSGIIVIGGDENPEVTESRKVPTALDSMRRYVTFMDLARRYPAAQLLYSGGAQFGHEGLQDSEVATANLIDLGIATDRLLVEKESRNTYENAIDSAALVHPDPSQKWLLVTSAWHMPRAIACFRKAGWNIYPAPTGYFTTGDYRFTLTANFSEQLRDLTMALHEYVGLVAYRLMGRTGEIWPK